MPKANTTDKPGRVASGTIPTKSTGSRKPSGSKNMQNPNDRIALDILEYSNKKPVRPYGRDEMIQSFQNGLSKGFINGLNIAVQFLESKDPKLANELQQFAKRSEEAQSGR
jgi:hypothetical protein